MKNIVSFETATRLKSAGFPQPAPEEGQVWAEPDGLLYFIAKIDNQRVFGHYIGGREFVADIIAIKDDIFCPTATDILSEMPSILISFEKYYITDSEFEVRHFGNVLASDANPAEAAAEAWLEINEKK